MCKVKRKGKKMLNEVTEFTFRSDGAWGAKNYFYRCVYNNIDYRGMVWVGANGAMLASVMKNHTSQELLCLEITTQSQ